MSNKKYYVADLNDAINNYTTEPGAATLYAVLGAVFEGIENNYTLPCPAMLNKDGGSFSPMFVQTREGKTHLVALTYLDGEQYPMVADVKLQSLFRLSLDLEDCEAIVFNPGTDNEFRLPKAVLAYGIGAGYQMAMEDYERDAGTMDEPNENDQNELRLKRPINSELFFSIQDRIINLGEDSDSDHIVFDLLDDPDMLFIQVARTGSGFHVELAFDMSDFKWMHPLILGCDLPSGETLELLNRMLVKGESPDNIDLVQNQFRQMQIDWPEEEEVENEQDNEKPTDPYIPYTIDLYVPTSLDSDVFFDDFHNFLEHWGCELRRFAVSPDDESI